MLVHDGDPSWTKKSRSKKVVEFEEGISMKLFGYGFDEKQDKPYKLREVTFSTSSPKELKTISEFLLESAALLEKKIKFDHLHLRDENKSWEKQLRAGGPDIIVFNERNESGRAKKEKKK